MTDEPRLQWLFDQLAESFSLLKDEELRRGIFRDFVRDATQLELVQKFIHGGPSMLSGEDLSLLFWIQKRQIESSMDSIEREREDAERGSILEINQEQLLSPTSNEKSISNEKLEYKEVDQLTSDNALLNGVRLNADVSGLLNFVVDHLISAFKMKLRIHKKKD